MKEEERTNHSRPILVKRFTPNEDKIIKSLAMPNNENDWRKISSCLEGRTARQCRDRWNNYLNPSLNRDEWKIEEDEILLKLYEKNGPQWTSFCSVLNGRSINDVRNRYFKLMRKNQKLSKSSSDNTISIKKIDKDKMKTSVETNTSDSMFKMNIFDNDLFSNFNEFLFDIDDMCREFDQW